MKWLTLALAVALFGPARAAAQPAHKLVVADAKQVSAGGTYELRDTKGNVTKWVAFVAEPPELPSQVKVATRYVPAGRAVPEKSAQARKVRLVEQNVTGENGALLGLKFNFELTLRSRELVELKPGEKPPTVPPLPPAERKLYLAPSAHIDYEAKAFRDWLDAKKLRRAKGESEIDLTARVLEVIRADFTYHSAADADQRASSVCKSAKTDCGGMSFALVAALRANGVPARALVGRFARSRDPNSKPGDHAYEQPHVRAEFFAAGVGWVPVDPAEARAGNNAVREYIGRDAGDLIVFHVDPDLLLPFPGKPREVGFLQVNAPYFAHARGAIEVALGPTNWDVTATELGRK